MASSVSGRAGAGPDNDVEAAGLRSRAVPACVSSQPIAGSRNIPPVTLGTFG